ncbi:site-specific integrase [bacterium]|nr:site-specific integrase [bacterium]
MTTVEPIRNKKDVERVERYLQKQSARDHLIFVFGTNCGLRISDIVALNVGDVRDKNYVQIVEKKTGKFKRFPLNEKLKGLIAEYVKGKRDREPLFRSLWGRRYNRITAYYMIRDACKAAGLEEKIGTHSMRKTFGYHHYQQFKDVVLLQKIFNHSSPQITLRYIGIEQDQIDYSYNNFVL